MKLKYRYFGMICALLAIPIAFLALVLHGFAQKQFETELKDKLSIAATAKKQTMTDVIDKYQTIFTTVSSRTGLHALVDAYQQSGRKEDLAAIELNIQDAQKPFDELVGIHLFDLQGHAVASNGMLPKDVTASALEQFQQITRPTIVLSESDGMKTCILVGPFLNGFDRKGTLVLAFSHAQIEQIADSLTSIGKTAKLLIAGKTILGDLVLFGSKDFREDPRRASIATGDARLPVRQALNKQETFLVHQKDYRGISVYSVTRYLPIADWGIALNVDAAEGDEPLRALDRTFAIVGAIGLFTTLIVALFLARTITDPIQELARMSWQIAAGKKRDPLPLALLTSKDEIGELSRSFDGMTYTLQKRQLKLDEDRARDEAILKSIGEGMISTDEQLHVIFMNEVAEEMLRWKLSEARGMLVADVVPLKDMNGRTIRREDRPSSKAIIRKTRLTSDPTRVIFVVRKDGSSFPVAFTISSIMVRGKVVGTNIVFRDITHEKEIDQAKTDFVLLASHQLRTPLSIVKWYGELLQDGSMGALSKEQSAAIKEIIQGNRRMITLVNALLNVTRIATGSLGVEVEPVQLTSLIERSLADIKIQYHAKKIHIVEEYASDVPTLHTDAKLLRIVLDNVLINAFRYTPDKGTVSVRVLPAKKGDRVDGRHMETDCVVFEVADSGYGIPLHQQSKIFTKLFRADNVREQDTEGSGLGLFISKSILDELGGSIWFESKQGKGTTFYTTLPLTS